MRCLVVAVCALAVVAGQRTANGADEPIAAVSEGFDPRAVDARRAQTRQRLRAAVASFDAHIQRQPELEVEDWRAYLAWDAWAAPGLNADQWSVAPMQRISKRLYAAREGFEHPVLVELRAALADRITFEHAVAEAHSDLEGEYRRRISCLARAAESPDVEFAELEAAAAWLASLGQAPLALAHVRRWHDQPVVVVQVHRDLVEAKLDSFSGESREVRAVGRRIQGAWVSGTATARSRLTAQLAGSPEEARLRVVSTGAVDAPRNTSTSGRVRVSSSSISTFSAVAEIYWDGRRFAATAPQATADMRTTIKRIDAPWTFRRVAERRVGGSRGAAEAEGRLLVERQVAESMAERLSAAVEKLDKKTDGFLRFLDRTGNSAVKWTTGLHDSAVHIGYRPPSPAGIGSAPHETPPLDGDETLGVSLHDAAVEGVFRWQLAGAEWKDVDFAILQRELTGANSEELLIGLAPERWGVQWSWLRPVSIHFSPAGATVRYRFARAEIDGAAYDAPFEVSARLRPSASALGLELQLEEPATVAGLDAEQPLPPHFQAFLEHKFRGLFAERMYLDGLQFPAGGAFDGMSAFRPASVRLENGWIHLRYTNRKPAATLVKHVE